VASRHNGDAFGNKSENKASIPQNCRSR